MSAALPLSNHRMTREEYLRWYDAQSRGRYERVDGYVIKMAAERGAHIRMKLNVVLALRRAVAEAGSSCQALPDGATVRTGDSDFEPDALVNCGERMGDDEVAAPNPVVVVEVLSPGIASVDTSLKLEGYFRVPSIAHYLIVHPTRRVVTHHRRTESAIATQLIFDGVITLDPPGMTITVDELYSLD